MQTDEPDEFRSLGRKVRPTEFYFGVFVWDRKLARSDRDKSSVRAIVGSMTKFFVVKRYVLYTTNQKNAYFYLPQSYLLTLRN